MGEWAQEGRSAPGPTESLAAPERRMQCVNPEDNLHLCKGWSPSVFPTCVLAASYFLEVLVENTDS